MIEPKNGDIWQVCDEARGLRERIAELEAAARELLQVDGGHGSKCYDAIRLFEARVALKRAAGMPLSSSENEVLEGR